MNFSRNMNVYGNKQNYVDKNTFAHKKRLVAKFSMRDVFLSDNTETEEITSSEVKIKYVCKYNSPTFGLNKLDCTYHNKYS